MNLLFTISSLGKGGAERVLLGLANKFAKEGNNVTVLTMFDLTNAYPIDDKVKVKTISIKHFEGSLINKGSILDYVDKCFVHFCSSSVLVPMLLLLHLLDVAHLL